MCDGQGGVCMCVCASLSTHTHIHVSPTFSWEPETKDVAVDGTIDHTLASCASTHRAPSCPGFCWSFPLNI